jgi:pimeloyl-[acyl-carrier protein] methyl ester esterase
LSGATWTETRQHLPGSAPDLPGYGDVASVEPYTAEGLADALASQLDAPTELIGWSMGGMVALALAARHPAKVSKLVLVGASPSFVNRPGWGHGLEAEVVEGFAAALSQDYQATLQRFLSLQARGDEAARQVIGRLRESLRSRAEPSQTTLQVGMRLLQTVDLRAVVGQVRCPTLVVHGAYDALCPIAAGRWLAAFIPGARLAEHARASHAPFLSHPGETAALHELAHA